MLGFRVREGVPAYLVSFHRWPPELGEWYEFADVPEKPMKDFLDEHRAQFDAENHHQAGLSPVHRRGGQQVSEFFPPHHCLLAAETLSKAKYLGDAPGDLQIAEASAREEPKPFRKEILFRASEANNNFAYPLPKSGKHVIVSRKHICVGSNKVGFQTLFYLFLLLQATWLVDTASSEAPLYR